MHYCVSEAAVTIDFCVGYFPSLTYYKQSYNNNNDDDNNNNNKHICKAP